MAGQGLGSSAWTESAARKRGVARVPARRVVARLFWPTVIFRPAMMLVA